MRSLLLLRTDGGADLDWALEAGADALVVSMPDVGGEGVRHAVRAFLQAAQLKTIRPLLYVRLASIEADGVDDDLAAVMLGEPDGIVLGRCRGGHDVQHLGVKLAVHEAEYGLADGETPIIAEAGSTARALFAMGSYCDASDRLMALVWDAQGLAVDLGTAHPAPGHAPMAAGRGVTLLAARAAEVSAIDTVSANSGEVLRAECEAARRDGFNAKAALDPAQIAIINEVFDRAA